LSPSTASAGRPSPPRGRTRDTRRARPQPATHWPPSRRASPEGRMVKLRSPRASPRAGTAAATDGTAASPRRSDPVAACRES
jgi:hypothetical protein